MSIEILENGHIYSGLKCATALTLSSRIVVLVSYDEVRKLRSDSIFKRKRVLYFRMNCNSI